jgi:hypothetical protein
MGDVYVAIVVLTDVKPYKYKYKNEWVVYQTSLPLTHGLTSKVNPLHSNYKYRALIF